MNTLTAFSIVLFLIAIAIVLICLTLYYSWEKVGIPWWMWVTIGIGVAIAVLAFWLYHHSLGAFKGLGAVAKYDPGWQYRYANRRSCNPVADFTEYRGDDLEWNCGGIL